ncbi:MAG: type VI secretion system baseplate subunit TssE [Proteobacteria bacterium]|nr:type VI secretion system baseplate subunit TssE [Pseudomonadota bacterium]
MAKLITMVSFIDKFSGSDPIEGFHLNELKSKIAKDLENLLNARRPLIHWTSEWSQLECSLMAYGVSDITGKVFDNAEFQNDFCKNLIRAISVFEPRLKDVRINIVENPGTNSSVMYLRIAAVLLIEPKPELITFDSVLKHELGAFSIEYKE